MIYFTPNNRYPIDSILLCVKKASSKSLLFLAAEEGFEPSQTESESVVLPLHNSATFYLT